jgi:hypothetical protein
MMTHLYRSKASGDNAALYITSVLRRLAILAAALLAASTALLACSTSSTSGSAKIVGTVNGAGLYLLRKSVNDALEVSGNSIGFGGMMAFGALPPPVLWVPDESIGNYNYGPAFYAKDPIRFVFALPSVAASGENFHVVGTAGACPALIMADFQVDLALSETPPPVTIWPSSRQPRVGDSRDDIIWNRGFPWEIQDRANLLKQNRWQYGVGIGGYSITFKNDHVSSIRTGWAGIH